MDPGKAILSFSPQVKSLTVGSTCGYMIFDLDGEDKKFKKIAGNILKDVFIIERLQDTSMVAIVAGDPKRLSVYHLRKNFELYSINYDDNILSVKFNQERMIVCTEKNILIYSLSSKSIIHTISDITYNFKGLIAVSPGLEQCYLAYQSGLTTGEVHIFDVINLSTKRKIPAHDNPLAALAFSLSGNEIATACELGNIIRVFSISDGAKLYEFRRGLVRYVTIACLSFSTCGDYLVSSSNTETVHIFRLKSNIEETRDSDDEPDEWLGYSLISYLGSTARNYLLPAPISEVFTQDRPFASVHLPNANVNPKCAIREFKDELRLLIATQDGFLYVYSVPSGEGDIPQFIKKHNLFSDYDYPSKDVFDLWISICKSASFSEESASATSSYRDDDDKASTSNNADPEAAEIENEFLII